jgi:hypothetical protein
MQKFVIRLAAMILVVTNFDWFLDTVFSIYETLGVVFEKYGNDYKVLAIVSAFFFLLAISDKLGE